MFENVNVPVILITSGIIVPTSCSFSGLLVSVKSCVEVSTENIIRVAAALPLTSVDPEIVTSFPQ